MRLRRLLLPLLAFVAFATLFVPSSEAHKRITADGRVIPHWVRYPFEFQLCGVALGSRAVDRDPFNRIDRYSLFFVHGNPTAVATPEIGVIGSAQAPPDPGVPLVDPATLGAWVGAVEIVIPPGHVEWLYRREGYAMGYVVDPLGFVTAVTVSGDESPIAATQMGDPYHQVRLGDDFRKVLFRYGYPDLITVFIPGGAGATGAEGFGGEGGAAGGGPGGPGGGAFGGRGAPGPAGSYLPDSRHFARAGQRDIQSLARTLEDLPKVITRSSARVNPKARSSRKPVAPLPPANFQVRASGYGGAFGMGGAMPAPGGPGMAGGQGMPGMGGAAGGAFGSGAAGGPGGPGEGGGVGGAGFGTGLGRTYQLDYRDTYNVIFTIRDNRVVRIFIWGDPDYFTDRTRLQMRSRF